MTESLSLLREFIEALLEAGRTDLPKYPGTFVGQTVSTAGQERFTRIPIKDKLNGTHAALDARVVDRQGQGRVGRQCVDS